MKKSLLSLVFLSLVGCEKQDKLQVIRSQTNQIAVNNFNLQRMYDDVALWGSDGFDAKDRLDFLRKCGYAISINSSDYILGAIIKNGNSWKYFSEEECFSNEFLNSNLEKFIANYTNP